MLTDAAVLKFLFIHENHQVYAGYIKTQALAKETATLIHCLDDYYATHPGDIDISEFGLWFFQYKHPDCSPTQLSIYKQLLERANSEQPALPQEVLESLYIAACEDRIADIINTDHDVFRIRDLLDELEKQLQIADSPHHVVNDITRLVNSQDRSAGLRWRLNCLNKAFGPIIKGDFIIAAAYVNTGKTGFAISEAVHMAQQLKEGRVLWFNNEEYDDRVLRKLWSCTLKAPWSRVASSPEKAEAAYLRKMNNDLERIKLFDVRGLTMSKLKHICSREDAKLIIVDQIDKVSGGGNKDGPDYLRLKGLYGMMRDIANHKCPVIAISQTDASVRWKNVETQEMNYQKYIDMSQLDGSKVGKQGEADGIITIGMENGVNNIRYLHAAKNKLDGEDPSYRDFKQPVKFNGELCLYEDDGF